MIMQNEKELRKGMYHLCINKHFKSKYFQNLGNDLIKLRWDLWTKQFFSTISIKSKINTLPFPMCKILKLNRIDLK